MTPLEHYREAERCLAAIAAGTLRVHEAGATNEEMDAFAQMMAPNIAIAQVHATLANCHMTAGVWEDKS